MKVFFIRGRLCGLCLMISQLVSSGLSLSTQKCLGETAHVQFTQGYGICAVPQEGSFLAFRCRWLETESLITWKIKPNLYSFPPNHL